LCSEFIDKQKVESSDFSKRPLTTLQREPISREKFIWVSRNQIFHFLFEHRASR
jgi:hypothetical protein